MFEALYITDTANNLVFQYSRNLSHPPFATLSNSIDVLRTEFPGISELNHDHFINSFEKSNLKLHILCSNESATNMLSPYIFSQRLIQCLEHYFGTPITISKIEANSDTLLLLVNEMIKDGIPESTDFNRLRDLVPYSSLLSKIVSTSNEFARRAAPSSSGSNASTKVISQAKSSLEEIPWRRSKVLYTNNEMYVDVIETINVIYKVSKSTGTGNGTLSSSKGFDSAFYSTSISKSSNSLVPLSLSVDGQVNFLSHLSGAPELHMSLSMNSKDIGFCNLHQCINKQKWKNSQGDMYFIPPDGKSTLLRYSMNIEDSIYRHPSSQSLDCVDVDFQYFLGSGNEFEIKVFIKDATAASKVETLSIEIITNRNQRKIKEDNTPVTGIKVNRLILGNFSFKPDGKGIWTLSNLTSSSKPLLRASLSYDTDNQKNILSTETPSRGSSDSNLTSSGSSQARLKPLYLKLKYAYKGSVPSGTVVDSIKVVNYNGMTSTVKPYKGVKYTTQTGEYIIRP